jgi:phage FluMu protein Com
MNCRSCGKYLGEFDFYTHGNVTKIKCPRCKRVYHVVWDEIVDSEGEDYMVPFFSGGLYHETYFPGMPYVIR